jgi:hypothetical protein
MEGRKLGGLSLGVNVGLPLAAISGFIGVMVVRGPEIRGNPPWHELQLERDSIGPC